jgi:hypothetical protein
MAKVYLKTSFVSACVWDRQDARSVTRQDESRRWWARQRQFHELSLSVEVLRELSDPSFRNSRDAVALMAGMPLLELDEEVLGFARILVRERVMPGPAEGGDAVHVAAATVYAIEYMVSWNVKHLANLNKVKHLREVCRRAGYVAPTIVTPDLLWT